MRNVSAVTLSASKARWNCDGADDLVVDELVDDELDGGKSTPKPAGVPLCDGSAALEPRSPERLEVEPTPAVLIDLSLPRRRRPRAEFGGWRRNLNREPG